MDKWHTLKQIMEYDKQMIYDEFDASPEHSHWHHFIRCIDIYLELMEQLEADEIDGEEEGQTV